MSHTQVHPGFTFSYLLRGALLQYRLYCSRFRIPAWTFVVNADCAMNVKWKMGMFSSGWKRLLEGISGAAGLRKFIFALSIYTHQSWSSHDNTKIFCDVKRRSLVDGYQSFGGSCCLQLQGRFSNLKMEAAGFHESFVPSTKLHVVIRQYFYLRFLLGGISSLCIVIYDGPSLNHK